MNVDRLFFQSLTTAAKLIRAGDVSSVEMTQCLLDRIARSDATLCSYVTVLPERALEQARRAAAEIGRGEYRGPLHGVPIAVKDLCATRGIRTTCASQILADWIPDHNATVVERLEAAGCVLLGKLNMTEFAMSGYHPSLPIPRNPWNLERATSGSSSGSGVATAAGLCFASLGTDTGGSIRGPAAWCGVVGLKPTYGRVSRHGVFPLAGSLDHVGPLTRTVADAAVMLQSIAGFDPNDPTSLRAPVGDYVSDLSAGVQGVRIAVDEAYASNAAAPEVVEAMLAVGRELERRGARLVEVRLAGIDAACRAWSTICAPEAVAAHGQFYPARSDEYGRAFRSFLQLGERMQARDYAAAHATRLEFAGRLAGIFEQADVLLCPGSFSVAPPADALPADMEFSLDFWPFMRFTAPFNLSGSPTLSVPCGFNPEGLPLGVQFVGRHLEEGLLCRVGHTYEQATPWHEQHPQV